MAATDPEMVSSTILWGWIENPAASISLTWLSVVWSDVLTRRYANVRLTGPSRIGNPYRNNMGIEIWGKLFFDTDYPMVSKSVDFDTRRSWLVAKRTLLMSALGGKRT
jgi:hypothetical protein